MEKNLIVITKDENFHPLGLISLPDKIETDKPIIISLDDKFYLLQVIMNEYIYTSTTSLKIALCKSVEKNVERNRLHGKNITTPSYLSNWQPFDYEPLTNEQIISIFFDKLREDKINLKSFFRKNKIEKILESENNEEIPK